MSILSKSTIDSTKLHLHKCYNHLMKLYFARHGDTDANMDTIPNSVSGEVDEPLNTLGVAQANDLAEELRGVRFDAIISSPLKRAHKTAEIVNRFQKLPIEVDAEWRERDIGKYVGPEAWNDMFDFEKNIERENVESLTDFLKRIYDAADDLKQKYKDKTVLIVAHGGVHHALHAYVNDLPFTGNIRIQPLKNCEYRVYEL